MKRQQIKVLLVDNADNCILFSDWFSHFQENIYKLEWLENYHVAAQAISQNSHDVYLVEYHLGEYSGLELIKSAITNGCNAPFILLTQNQDVQIQREATQANIVDYLPKNQLSAPLLERCLRYAIECKQKEQDIYQKSAFLDVINDAIIVQDVEGKILFWNQAAVSLYSWTKEEILTKNVSILYPLVNLAEFSTALETVIRIGIWEGELHQKNKHGQEIIVKSRWKLWQSFGNCPAPILVINIDITQKKQLETQLLRTQRLESIGTLASGIAHDLNNVLTPILMTAQLLEGQMYDERSRRLLPILISNAKRGANLVKQILSFTRGLEGNRTILQIKHLIIEIQQIIKETFPKSIEVLIQLPSHLWTVCGDATQLHQVLMNLCVNARDAMPNGGTLKILAENLLVDENYAQMYVDAKAIPYVVVTVSDTGVGIQPTIINHIFEPFFTTKDIGKGTGLGLSTVLSIIKNHGGFIQVCSEEGKGSQFKVYLPAQDTIEIIKESTDKLPQGNGELILVIDDETAVLEVTKTSLESYNYQVITASDGIEAIALYVENRDKISLVLADIIMPLMDGITSIRTLQKINPNVKIIAISGLASTEKFNTAYNMGVNAFLCKPFTANQLLQTINTVNGKNSP
ncbi:MAG TPA: response regulator [Nostocaceae cyanobacterium]|nr:response regulator [Nostocaceae cyanobacterium]